MIHIQNIGFDILRKLFSYYFYSSINALTPQRLSKNRKAIVMSCEISDLHEISNKVRQLRYFARAYHAKNMAK